MTRARDGGEGAGARCGEGRGRRAVRDGRHHERVADVLAMLCRMRSVSMLVVRERARPPETC